MKGKNKKILKWWFWLIKKSLIKKTKKIKRKKKESKWQKDQQEDIEP